MAGAGDSTIAVPDVRLEEAANVLEEAFNPDPMVRWLLEDTSLDYGVRVHELMRFSCQVRLLLGWPLLGVEQDGKLLGVIGVTMPDEKEWPESLQEVYRNLGTTIGAPALKRLEEYSRLADAGRPSKRHYHVGMIGVAPDAQGQGVGRRLLNAVHEMSQEDEASVGVALDTENPDSRRFYEANGYQCTREDVLDGVRIWSMFRPSR